MSVTSWVAPGGLRLPPSRRSVDLAKLARQYSQFGRDFKGMPAIEVTRCARGILVINDGVTCATRAHRYGDAGSLVPVIVIDERPLLDASAPPRVADVG